VSSFLKTLNGSSWSEADKAGLDDESMRLAALEHEEPVDLCEELLNKGVPRQAAEYSNPSLKNVC